MHATQVIRKHVCGNILYAFITGDPVKRSTVDIMKYTYTHQVIIQRRKQRVCGTQSTIP